MLTCESHIILVDHHDLTAPRNRKAVPGIHSVVETRSGAAAAGSADRRRVMLVGPGAAAGCAQRISVVA
jgi:hypothetical protein